MNEEDNKKVAYYVKSLLNNSINTNDVPVYLIPKINIVLTIAKKNAIANGQVNSVKQIQQIMAGLETIKGKNHHVDSIDQITNSRRRCQTAMTPSPKKSTNLQKVSKSPTRQKSQSRNLPNINQSHSQSPKMKKNIRKSNNVKSTKLNDSTFTKEQLDSVLEDLISGSLNEPQKEMIPELIHHSKEKTNSLIEKEELIEAQKYENITRKLITLNTDRINIENKSNRKEEFNSQLQKALNNLEIAQENLENDLKAYDAQLKDAREAQRIEWEQTLEDFDRVTSGELPKSYKKYSPKLLGLREASKNLIKLRRYEEAGYKKMEADELEEIEFEECRQKYITARQAQKAKIIESHNQKMQCFEENGERIR
ncbi:hypothetical protein TRFO_35030 [Tritrichomonas foetus]|uniref:Uncharacterized protein n=1 Tax=Tritrichomonas foetus TaxID=1144522 RepID=A0A1J4JH72_9EUKA|nr:hypothetical protein TRFO_35030 [Tritrichomonas foetus]|eukprot:OHS98504.1 hypothetical protein TRFO_35030 [Tritrichomonas foetus]